MGIERYLGFHFTDTCIYIAEAYAGRDDHLHWDVVEQANYELDPEWLPLFKDAIPNLYDNDNGVYGFAALPSIWSSFRFNRFVRFNSSFFEKASQGKLTDDDRRKLAGLFRYCQVFHIRPQPDETLVATVVTERLKQEERQAVQQFLLPMASDAGLDFVDVIEPDEACLRYLWYEDVHQGVRAADKRILLVHLGYRHTTLISWNRCQAVEDSALAPGMLEIDRGVAMYAGKMGMGKTVGMDELLLYAQRARRSFELSQASVKIVDNDVDTSVYLDIIREGVGDIALRLQRFLSNSVSRKKPIDQIFLTGEGAAFAPVVDAFQLAKASVPMHYDRPQPTYAAARGAAAKSWAAKNQDSEVR